MRCGHLFISLVVQVFVFGFTKVGFDENQLDLSELSNGMYFISIDGYTARVVKK